ncbi:MAG TPA: pyrimidine reductase family protein [Streptosporangiaceae bacterium]|nr:pyrimidine reductase family protein [Streptosporangiaceae bacterium]
MRLLFPEAITDPELAQLYAYPADSAVSSGGRPWVRANMVESVDGAASVDGRSGGLSGDADRQTFRVLRSLADVVLVGSGTVRDEHYRPAQVSAMVPGLRAGRSATPPIAVISGRLNLDLSSSLFTDAPPDARTIVITSEKAPLDQRKAVAEHADVIAAGTDGADLGAALSALAERGLGRVLTEGGPHLLAQLASAGHLDELCVTVSPVLGAGHAGRILAGPSLPGGLVLSLGHVLEDQGFLLCRYLVTPGAARPPGSAR